MAQKEESPCVNVCELNLENICTGCFRTIDEIAQWGEMDNGQKAMVLQKSLQRKSTGEGNAND